MSIESKQKSSHVPRKSYAKLPEILEVPDLLRIQTESFRWFRNAG